MVNCCLVVWRSWAQILEITSACRGKTAYIYPPQTSLGGSLVYWDALFCFLICPLVVFLGYSRGFLVALADIVLSLTILSKEK